MKEWKIEKTLARRYIEWRFNPVDAPHSGGVWERLVRNSKKLMYNVLKAQNINEDILRTTIFIVEGILNRRRLTPHSDDNEKFETIIPNHYLIGSSGSEMFRNYSKGYKSHHRNLKLAQLNANQIWQKIQTVYTPMH